MKVSGRGILSAGCGPLMVVQSHLTPPLFIPLNRGELRWVAPDPNCLLSWDFPQVTEVAIQRASWVASDSLNLVQRARALGTKAALIIQQRGKRPLHVPHLQWSSNLSGNELEEFFSKMPLIKKETPQLPTKKFSVACIVSAKVLPQWVGLFENLIQLGAPEFYVLTLDQESLQFLTIHYPGIRIYGLNDLWKPHEQKILLNRTIPAQAYSSKGALVLRAIQDGASAILYSDLDIFYFQSPKYLWERLNRHCDGLLFPHWNRSYENSRQHGIYNAGMFLVSKNAVEFLNWWKGLCLCRCDQDLDTGHYDDQAYLDMAPLTFPRIHPYLYGDQNVGGWNFETLGVRFCKNSPGDLELENGRRVNSLHATHADSRGFFEVKYAWDHAMCALYFADYFHNSELLRSTVWEIHKRYFLSVRRLDGIYQALSNRRGVFRFPSTIEKFLVGKGENITRSWIPFRNIVTGRATKEFISMFTSAKREKRARRAERAKSTQGVSGAIPRGLLARRTKHGEAYRASRL